MGRRVLGRLASGEVVVDRSPSHLHEDGAAENIEEALGRVSSRSKKFIETEVSFDRVVGQTICVETDDTDRIVYAKRRGRDGYSRFTKSRKPKDCDQMVVVLKRIDWSTYILITAFVGESGEREPFDPEASSESLDYWSNHALVWGEEEVVLGTETTDCPW